MDPRKEKTVGCVLAAGVVLVVLSLVLSWVFGVAGIFHGTATRTPGTDQITDAGPMNLVPLMILMCLIGCIMVAWAIGYGLLYNRNSTRGPRQSAPYARILSRYGSARNGQMVTADYELEADDVRFYVRMQLGPNVPPSEYECARETFYQAGEGMVGEAELQGRWMGKFTPYIGLPPA